MAIEGRKEAKRMMKEEEEERLRKRKWKELKSKVMEMKKEKDNQLELEILDIPGQAKVSKLLKIDGGGSQPKGGNTTRGGVLVGTGWPDDYAINGQSLDLETKYIQQNLKYGTPGRANLLSLGPVSDAVDLVVEKDKLNESESNST